MTLGLIFVLFNAALRTKPFERESIANQSKWSAALVTELCHQIHLLLKLATRWLVRGCWAPWPKANGRACITALPSRRHCNRMSTLQSIVTPVQNRVFGPRICRFRGWGAQWPRNNNRSRACRRCRESALALNSTRSSRTPSRRSCRGNSGHRIEPQRSRLI